MLYTNANEYKREANKMDIVFARKPPFAEALPESINSLNMKHCTTQVSPRYVHPVPLYNTKPMSHTDHISPRGNKGSLLFKSRGISQPPFP